MSDLRKRLYVVAVLGAIALMGILAFAVFQFGLKNPSPPSLIDNPNPAIAGRIAYINDDGCIMIADASGASRRQVSCVIDYAGVTWSGRYVQQSSRDSGTDDNSFPLSGNGNRDFNNFLCASADAKMSADQIASYLRDTNSTRCRPR